MKRAVILGLVLTALIAAVVSSAATLHVDGGVIQAFALSGDALSLPEVTMRLQRVANPLDYGFRGHAVECVESEAVLWASIGNSGAQSGELAVFELWHLPPGASEDVTPERVTQQEIKLPESQSEVRFQLEPPRGVGMYRFRLVFVYDETLEAVTAERQAAFAEQDGFLPIANVELWSGEVVVDDLICATPTPTATPTLLPTGTQTPTPTGTLTPTSTLEPGDTSEQGDPPAERDAAPVSPPLAEPTLTPSPEPTRTSPPTAAPTVAPTDEPTPVPPTESPPAEEPTSVPAETPPADPPPAGDPPEGEPEP